MKVINYLIQNKDLLSTYASLYLIERMFKKDIKKINLPDLQLRGSTNLSFSSSEIDGVYLNKKQLNISLNTAGLFGIQGSMPIHYTERLMELIRKQDYVLRDFIDIFNHRIIVNLYRIHKASYPIYWKRKELFSTYGAFVNKFNQSKIYSKFTLQKNLEFIFKNQIEVKINKVQPRFLRIDSHDRITLNANLENKLLGSRVIMNDSIVVNVRCKNESIYDLINSNNELDSIVAQYYNKYTIKILFKKVMLNHSLLRDLVL